MARKKVIAYYMHEHEQAEVEKRLEDANWTESYLIGTLDDEGIDQLEERGILVEVLGDVPPETDEVMVEATKPDDDLPMAMGIPGEAAAGTRGGGFAFPTAAAPERGATFDVPGGPLSPVLHPSKDNVFAVSLTGPVLLEDWRDELTMIGVELRERLPDERYLASLSLTQVGQTRDLPFVESVELFAPADSGSAVFRSAAATRGAPDRSAEAAEPVPFDVLLHRPEDLDDVLTWMADEGLEVLGTGRRKLRVEVPSADSPVVRRMEALPEVRQVAEYVEPTLGNQVARELLGLDADTPEADAGAGNPSAAPAWPHDGAGELVAVADSGLDENHPDFADRIRKVVARARPDGTDLHGHGTHVAGSIAGDGTASNGAHRGTAPGAELFFQSIMDGNERLTGLPVDLGDLLEEAYQAGARIHNNSWSADTKSFYTLNAMEVDRYVEEHPDLLVVIAAGNTGSAQSPFNAETGFVDWQSIGSPATAKNALTVGASRSSRSEGGLANRTWQNFDSRRFSDPPIAQEKISGDAECLAAFSSRGPCDPRRLKPDLVAPGTNILSTRAAGTPSDHFWGGVEEEDRYGYMGGTSMATPLVAGCAALVREFYQAERGHRPSAALVKATLINGTKRLEGDDALADHPAVPNYHQGFGRLHMPWVYPNPREDWLRLDYVDSWGPPPAADAEPFVQTGQRRRFAFTVEDGSPFLRLCLVWSDPASGDSLQNKLGVILEHGGLEPPKVLGNRDRPSPVGRMDRDNNVQIIRLDNPPPGNYLVQVFAASLLKPRQDWAMVVTGALDGGLTEI